MLQRLPLPALLVLIGAAISGYFTFLLAESFIKYFSLTEKSSAQIVRWEIKEIEGTFALQATYSFEAQGKMYGGVTTLSKPWYLNEAAAIEALKGLAKRQWTAYFDPRLPTWSSIEHQFPSGLLFRALISCCVFVYFIFFCRKFKVAF